MASTDMSDMLQRYQDRFARLIVNVRGRRAVSVWPFHLELRYGAVDDGAHQFEQVGTYATQIPEARARR